MPALVFDLGGTFLRCGVIDAAGELANLRKHTISGDWPRILDLMVDYCGENSALVEPDAPISIAFPGPVRQRRHAFCAPTVAGMEAPPDIAAHLRAATGRDVMMLNDVSAAALHVGTQLDDATFMVVTISSGIGSKVFHRAGSQVFDQRDYGGEIGHVVIDRSPGAPMCECGGRGHLGAVASGRGTLSLAQRMAREDPQAFAQSQCVRVFAALPGTLENEAHLVPAAKRGDRWTWNVIRRAMEPLAQTLAIVTAAVGLDRIVLIGGFALELGEPYREALADAMRAYCDGTPCAAPVDDLLLLWDRDDEPCLRGAGVFARNLSPAVW